MSVSAMGEDRSAYQTVGPWNFNGCTWGIAKATEALDYQDPNFPANWDLMRTQLQHRGAYHFLHPQLDPVLQADYFISYVEKHGVGEQAVLVVDSELAFGPAGGLLAGSVPSLPRRSHLLAVSSSGEVSVRDGVQPSLISINSPRSVDECTYQFLLRVHEHRPHNPLLVYTNKNVGSMLPSCAFFPVWIAYPSLTPPSMEGLPWSDWIAWQWAWTGGYDNCDQDSWNGSAADMTHWVESFKAVKEKDFKRWSVRGPWSLEHEASIHHTTPAVMLDTAREAGWLYGERMQRYIETGDWARRLPFRAQLFAPVHKAA